MRDAAGWSSVVHRLHAERAEARRAERRARRPLSAAARGLPEELRRAAAAWRERAARALRRRVEWLRCAGAILVRWSLPLHTPFPAGGRAFRSGAARRKNVVFRDQLAIFYTKMTRSAHRQKRLNKTNLTRRQ